MAKGQKNSGREPKKPKQVKKAAAPAASPFAVSGGNRGGGARGQSK
jgi:hypothetical protein